MKSKAYAPLSRKIKNNTFSMNFNKKLNLKRVLILFFILITFFSNFISNTNININTKPKEDLSYEKDLRSSNQENDIFKLIFGTSSGPYSIDPLDSWDTASFNVIDQVCEGLFTYNLTDPNLQIIPHLATSKGTWMINSTDTWYTVSLRPNVLFHDGAKFNATAVKFTFDRLSYFMNVSGTLPQEKTIAVIASLYKYFDPDLGIHLPIVNDTVIIDEYTIRFELNRPYGPFEALLCFPASFILSPMSTPQFEYINITSGDLVGTGPFVYDHYLIDNEVKFHAFENYWAGRANITILKFSIIDNAITRNNALLSGEVDLIIDPQPSMYSALDADPDVRLIDAGNTATVYPLQMSNYHINVTFRNAISYAINYSYIINELYGGNGVRLKSPLPENVLFANWSLDVATYNVTKAREIMQSMGFGLTWDTTYPGTDEGLWSAATFASFNYTYNLGNQFREDTLMLLEDNLDKIGIDVIDAGMNWSEYLERMFYNGVEGWKKLQLFWSGWLPDFNDPSNYINTLLTNRTLDLSNFNTALYDGYSAAIESGRDPFNLWDNVQLLMEAALNETNQNIRKLYYDRIQQILVEEDMPWAYCFVPRNYDAYRSHILGFQSNAMGILKFYGVTQDSTISPNNIYIDGNQEWLFFKNASKCTGQGTSSDPYVIEDLVIDSRNSSVSCIHIENSDVYFRIENCTLYNSTDAGIKLTNTTNGQIIDNNCSNNGVGINLYNLNTNFNITANYINNNAQYGMFVNNSTSTLIYNNSFIANNMNAFESVLSNSWDNGSIGNYWDDYAGADENDDGIGDSSYPIPGPTVSQDNFPLFEDGIDQGDDIFKLVFGTDYGPSDLDPHVAWDSASFDVITQVCEGLFKYKISDPNLPIIPNLATSWGTWMINSTDTWYTVSLRSDVFFHDGTKFNATAVKFTFDRLKYFINNSMAQAHELYEYYDPDLGTTLPIIDNTVIVDEFTIRFELNKPYGVFEHLLCFPGSSILSPTSTPQFDVIDTNTGDLVGTGPFVYDYYLPNIEVKFHAFENFWAGRANITILKFLIINDAVTRNNALLTGDVDLLVDPLTSMFSLFDSNPDITLVNAGQDMIIQYLGMNNQMINNTWRKAISYAINYSYIINELYGGNAVRLKSPIPENMPYANWSFDIATFNISKAREIMQSMGFGIGWDTTYPGTNEAEWSAATFRTYNYTYNIGNTLREDILVLLQDNLDKIGIEVTDAGMTWSNYVYRLYEIEPYTRNMLELFWMGWGPDYCDPSTFINPLFTNRSLASNGVQYNAYTAAIGAGRDPYDPWDNVQLLMEAAIFETDPNARNVMYQRIQQLLVEEDMPWAFGCIAHNYDAYRSHILGFQSNAMGILSFYDVTQDSAIAPQTISIDGNQEWQYLKNEGICTGQGTSVDPYVIEDLVIDARNESVSCIHIENSDVYFRIENCTLFNSNVAGIKLINASNGEIIGNNCSNNSVGIHLDNFNLLIINNTNIIGNFIYNNSQFGLFLNNVSNTLVFDNNFTANNVNAFDNWTSNAWDNGTFGNYWDDYGGVDANDDGIGDTPYIIPGPAGSQDNFPIWDDGINIIAAKIDNIILNGENKTIDKSISLYYNELLEIIITYRENLTSNFINAATVNITGSTITAFFVENASAEYYILTLNTSDLMIGINDLEINAYKVNYTQISTNITVTVFASNLSMYIVSPSADQLFGAMAPAYNVEISGTNLDTMWYSLDGGLTNITFISNGTIDQTEWDKLVNGTVTIIFYANDTLGNVISNSVKVRKDIVAPFVTINSPGNNTYWNTPPTINIIAFDSNLDTIWYTVGITNVMITNNTDVLLDASIWVSLPDEGVFQMSIFANDTVGNLNNIYILSLYKDIKIPTITNVNSTKANGSYTIGEVILIEVLFSELVYVTGTPQLTLETGSVDAIVNYTNGTGTTILTFTYTVAPGHISPDLDYISTNALSLNGGTIKDFVGNDANLTLSDPGSSGSLGYNKDIIINTNAPNLLINQPISNSVFGITSPNFNVEINDKDGVDTMWYTLDGGLTNITFITNGTIDQNEWNKLVNGIITIIFYANDTLGNLASDSVTVRKDTIAPDIIIISPISNELFGSLAPTFSVEITDINGIDTMWYTLDGGLINITFISNGTIDQSEWAAQSNGTVTITFYANDTAGNLASNSVTVRKDIEVPNINITSPLPNELFGSLAPTFSVEITDSNGIDMMWYTLDGGLTNITFLSNGTINQIEWAAQSNGTVTITFYANDTIGNLAFNSVVVRKDIEIPDIIINSPLPNELFGSLAPSFILEITDSNGIDTMWYTLDGGLTNLTFITNGTIDQIEWDAQLNGTVTITFYANDTLGNVASNSVIVRKDIEGPSIIINSPISNELFGSLAPSFNVEVTDINGIDTMWYTLDGGLTNFTFITNGTIDQIEWNTQLNGTVTITFYANDTVGNTASNFVIIRKDIEIPDIIINSPLPNELFGSLAPNFTVEITDINGIDTMWYTLDGGITNFTFITNGTIDQIEWNAQLNGTVTITFYANDTIGNIASDYIIIRKDIEIPDITINSPLPNELFGSLAPNFTVEITDSNGIDAMWYTLDAGLTNFTLITNGTIDQIEWDAQTNGTVTITFYANDTLGNLGSNSIVIRKDVLSGPTILINTPASNSLFGYSPPDYNIELTAINGLDKMWYTLDGGLTNLTFITNGTIDQIEWNAQLNGTVTITFNANDTLGNVASNSIVVRKDIEIPDITIYSPIPNELFGPLSPSFNVEITDINGIDTMWYTLDGGLTNLTFITNGTIDQIEWGNKVNGTLTITFYANDTVGNLASYFVVIRKDIEIPDITINLPLPNELFGSLAPSFNVEITDINGINTMWYTLNGGLTNFIFIANGTIDQIEWNGQLNGTVTISFYANDTLGNLAFNSIVVRKDVLSGPTILVNTPSNNSIFGYNSPNFNVEINNINGVDTMWYTLDGGITNITFIANGTIDQTEWDAHGNGTVTIRFYSNNTLGKVSFMDITVRKDIEIPVITIHSPEIDEIFQLISPDFNISITEINLDFTWYSLSNNTYATSNFTFAGLTGKIDQGLWDNFFNDSIEIHFYAIDKAGNIGFQNVTVMKLPEYYSLESTVIDDTGAGNYTWGQAQAQEWCYGSGTWNDPYIIEFLIINGHNAGSNLIIRNSSAFFIIRNSILYNSGGKSNDAGLKLEHVSNAILINLDCSNNNGHGIYLFDCENITIMESSMNHNKLAGIFLRESNYNRIVNNTETINYNHWGIYLLLSHSNTIGGSYLGFNQIGLLFNQSNNNLITHNFFNRNDEAYVEKDSNGNIFIGNEVVTKPDILIVIIITAVSIVSISGVSFVIVRQKIIIPKKGRKIKVYDKKKFKVEEKLHNRLLVVDHLIEEKNVKEALKDLEEIKDLCKVYGLFEILKECDEKVTDCNCKYLEMINIIKRIVLNLATKFARLEIIEISEQAGIRDEDFIIEVLQEMIQNNEIKGEYFSKSKAVAFDKQSNIEQIEQFIKIYREWEMLNLERDDSELLLEEIRSEELKPKAIVSKLLPEKVKELKIFLSYSTMDIDHFQILKIVENLEEYPEIDKVMYWESDKVQEVTDYKEFMDKTLNEYDVFLLFCSENSMKSASVNEEWQIAFEKREKGLIKIIPVYDKLDMIPVILGHILSVHYDKKQFDNFIKNLYQEIMRSRSNRIS